jgi:succinyl-CoA synthetase beta subunit
MAKLHEYQGKKLLQGKKISIPNGGTAKSSSEVKSLAEKIGTPVVIKAQAWITGRAGIGAIRFADTPDEAALISESILGMEINNFTVDTVLVEERLAVKNEFYAGVVIDDQEQSPVVIFSSKGGSGIEEIAKEYPQAVARLPIDVRKGLHDYKARDLVRNTRIRGRLQLGLGNILVRLYDLARDYDARSAEINPIILTEDGKLIAADCRITIDDYAVFRHPELGIEIAREFERPPTKLERIAWQVERNDYRGTFYFIQMEQKFQKGEGVIGFHGAGGGGSMMSMDAVLNQGYKLANFVDTSGNPPASKVYRAARIILAQEGIDGYFGSGSGVASQEQFHSARGLVKAFMEIPLVVPAVIRLGGNAEERAISIIERAQPYIPAKVEAYGKDDSPEFCAQRMHTLIQEHNSLDAHLAGVKRKEVREAYSFDTVSGGSVSFDHSVCRECYSKVCVESCVPGILSLKDEAPVLNITKEEASKGGCTECLACDVECFFDGKQGGYVKLPIPGLLE